MSEVRQTSAHRCFLMARERVTRSQLLPVQNAESATTTSKQRSGPTGRDVKATEKSPLPAAHCGWRVVTSTTGWMWMLSVLTVATSPHISSHSSGCRSQGPQYATALSVSPNWFCQTDRSANSCFLIRAGCFRKCRRRDASRPDDPSATCSSGSTLLQSYVSKTYSVTKVTSS